MIRSALLASFLLGAVQDPNARPNVILFLADDLGYGDLGCYGSAEIKTPNLDAFAGQGVRLTQCYSASAVCSPSRSALLTGRTPYRNGCYTWIAEGSEVHLRTSEITLPSLLRKAGYATCHVGKWHLNGKFNGKEQPQPGDHGYDWWMATQNNAAPSHRNPGNFARNGKAVGPLEGYSAPLVVEEAIRWLREQRNPAKPFFLAVWAHEPHLPIESDPKFQEPYAHLADPDIRQHHGNVTQLDHAFGSLMKALDETKLAASTVVWFTSDNGPEGDGLKGRTRGSQGALRGRKKSMYEGGIRVPGIVRWPGRIRPGTVEHRPVIGSDLLPTVCAMTGIPAPKDRTIDGVDAGPILRGEPEAPARTSPLFWRLGMATDGLPLALREGDWKILANEKFDRFELYDLATDPMESKDRAASDPAVFDRLKARLLAFNAEVEADGPDWWKRLSPSGALPPKK
jgi:arylsulfatase A